MNNKEDIKTDVIIIEDDYVPQPIAARPKKTKKSKKRKVKVDKSNNMETLVITQKVQMKKKKIQCIINLTNKCEHNEERKREQVKSDYKLKCSKASQKERIVPNCLRRRCQLAIYSKSCQRSERKRKTKLKRVSSRKSKRSSKLKSRMSNTKFLSPVSSIDSLILEDDCKSDISYDSISSGSLCSYDIDEELDTLIKRTKERERRLSRTYSYVDQSVQGGISQHVDECTHVGFATPVTSEIDGSIHSRATVILDNHMLYSPTQPTESPTNFFIDDTASKKLLPNSMIYPVTNEKWEKPHSHISDRTITKCKADNTENILYLCSGKTNTTVINPLKPTKIKTEPVSPKSLKINLESTMKYSNESTGSYPIRNIPKAGNTLHAPTIHSTNRFYHENKQEYTKTIPHSSHYMTSTNVTSINSNSKLCLYSPSSRSATETYLPEEKYYIKSKVIDSDYNLTIKAEKPKSAMYVDTFCNNIIDFNDNAHSIYSNALGFFSFNGYELNTSLKQE